MIQTLIKNWWLLALLGVLDAILALMSLSMQNPDRSLAWGILGLQSTAMDMCRLAVAAGALTIAAGIWRSGQRGRSWLLVMNGLALSAYGLLPLLWTGPLGFRLFACLIAVMAMSMGILELAISRTLRRQMTDKWFLNVAGAGSVGFASAFLALVLRWITLEPAPPWRGFLWLASYFGFSAICMLGMALRLRRPGLSPSGQREALAPLGNPKHEEIQDSHTKQAAIAAGT